MSLPLTGGLGQAAYLAMVTDTGNFSYGNTRPSTLETGAEILRQGLKPASFTASHQNQWPLARFKLWSEVLADARLDVANHVMLSRVTLNLFERTGTSRQDCEGMVEFLRRIKGVRVAVLLREETPVRVKFSLRSQGADDVQRIAAQFGGGGHRNASGGSIDQPIDQAEQILLRAVRESIEAADARG